MSRTPPRGQESVSNPLGRRLTILSAWLFFSLLSSATNGIAEEPLNDPTRPPEVVAVAATEAKEEQPGPLSLQAVFFADGRRVAIINDQRVQEQDIVESAYVVAITRDRVRLRRGADSFELRLVQHDIKQDASPSTLPAAIAAPLDPDAPQASLPKGTRP